MKLILLLSVTIAGWTLSDGYKSYQSKIPNGQRVPHPCVPDTLWGGVGHVNPLGGGDRNQFGKDFARLGKTWSRELCQLDSDGDGETNGEELGDPTCVWREGDLSHQTDHISHPGICGPFNSTECTARNSWVSCEDTSFHCDAIHEPDVEILELKFPRSKVPAQDTTYTCFSFDLPSDKPYHFIAFEPIIDNANVMHHMVAYACDDTAELYDSPTSCDMGPTGCTETLAVWTIGINGDCFHNQTGFRFGQGSVKRISIQHHWTNTDHVDHWYDESGMKMYYTPRIRAHDVATMTIGQSFLEIPSGIPSLTLSGSCSVACTTKYMKGPLNVVAALNHMHYLGISGKIEIIRNGHVIYNLTNENPFHYDNPQVIYYRTPVQLLPGDEMKMNCEFSSTTRNRTTNAGLSTSDEMCYGFLTYYPKENFGGTGNCIQWKETDMCQLNDPAVTAQFYSAFNISLPQTTAVFKKITDNCNVYGACRTECRQAIADIRAINPAYGGQLWEYLKSSIWDNKQMNYAPILRFLSAIDTCDRPVNQSPSANHTTGGQPTHPGVVVNPGQGANATNGLLQLVKVLGKRPLLQNIIFNFNGNN